MEPKNNFDIWDKIANKYKRSLKTVVGHLLSQFAIDYIDKTQRYSLLKAINKKKFPTILEIGCGHGRWASCLAPHVKEYYGIDTSKSMIELAKSSCKFKNVFFIHGTTDKLPLRNYFDFVFTVYVFKHVINNNDLEKMIMHGYNNLKNNGIFIIIESTSISPTSLTNKDLEPPYVIRRANDYIEIFKKNGFSLIKIRGVRLDFNMRIFGWYKKFIQKIAIQLSIDNISQKIIMNIIFLLDLLFCSIAINFCSEKLLIFKKVTSRSKGGRKIGSFQAGA